MREPTFMELMELTRELERCKDMKIDQFYELSDGRFRIKLGNRGGKANVHVEIPHYMAFTDSPEVREDATGFAIAVRKRITNAAIKDIRMYNNDRIIMIDAEKAGEEIHIIFEMFGRGNLVITGKGMEILLAYRPHVFADRSVKTGETYTQPKSEAPDLTDAKAVGAYIDMLVQTGKGRIGKVLRPTGLGGLYLEEAMARARIDPAAKASDVKADGAAGNALRESVLRILGECEASRNGMLYINNGIVSDYSMVHVSKYSGMEERAFGTLAEAMQEYYLNAKPDGAVAQDKKTESIRASIEKQKELIDETIKQEEECRSAAKAISANAAKIEVAIRVARDKKSTEAEAEAAAHIRVKAIDRKARAMTVEV